MVQIGAIIKEEEKIEADVISIPLTHLHVLPLSGLVTCT